MLAIRTVACPVDFSPATRRQLDLAIDLCRAFNARLVLHHNITDVSIGAAVGWMWHADHAAPESSSAAGRMRELVARIPAGIPMEACITRGGTMDGVMRISEAAEADLIVLSGHAAKTEGHASVIEYLIEHATCAVLALHDLGEDAVFPSFRRDEKRVLQSLLVPVNLTGPSHPNIDVACDLARMLPVRLHLLHVVESRVMMRATGGAGSVQPRLRLKELVPEDLAERVTVHVETGDPVPVIADVAKRVSAACIVMGEHTRVPLKRWFTHDTSRAVLHDTHCPVWYVPPAVA